MQHIPASAQAIYNTIFALFFLEEYLNLLSFVTLFTSKFRAEVWSVMQSCTQTPVNLDLQFIGVVPLLHIQNLFFTNF